MKISPRGQVTIPVDIREKPGLEPGDEVEFLEVNGYFVLRKPVRTSEFEDMVGAADDPVAPTTDEILEATRGSSSGYALS